MTPPAIRGAAQLPQRNPKNRLHDIADARIVIEDTLAGRSDEPFLSLQRRVALRAVGGGSFRGARRALRVGGLSPGGIATTRPRRTSKSLGCRSTSGRSRSRFRMARSSYLPIGAASAWVVAVATATRRTRPDRRRDLALGRPARLDEPTARRTRSSLRWRGSATSREARSTRCRSRAASLALAEVALPRGATWCEDGFLVYNRDVAEGLWRVAAAAKRRSVSRRSTPPCRSAPSLATRHPRHAQVPLSRPGARSEVRGSTIELLDLDTGSGPSCTGAVAHRITRDGVLLYARDRAHLAARLDLAKGTLLRQPVRVRRGRLSEWSGGAQFDFRTTAGSSTRSAAPTDRRIAPGRSRARDLRDDRRRAGVLLRADALPRRPCDRAPDLYRGPLRSLDLRSRFGEPRRLTFGGRDEFGLEPDGRCDSPTRACRKVIARPRGCVPTVSAIRSALAPSTTQRSPTSWTSGACCSPTSRRRPTRTSGTSGARSPAAARPVLATAANERRADVSPDGRWMLYDWTNRGGRRSTWSRRSWAGGRCTSRRAGPSTRTGGDGRAAYFWSRASFGAEIAESSGARVRGPHRIFIRSADPGHEGHRLSITPSAALLLMPSPLRGEARRARPRLRWQAARGSRRVRCGSMKLGDHRPGGPPAEGSVRPIPDLGSFRAWRP